MKEIKYALESDIKVSLHNMGTVNKNMVCIEKAGRLVRLYFSYETLVAVNGIVSINNWSMTTEKLLNQLEPNKKLRVSHEEVLKEAQIRLKEVLAKCPCCNGTQWIGRDPCNYCNGTGKVEE